MSRRPWLLALPLLAACGGPPAGGMVFIQTSADGGFSMDRYEFPNQRGTKPTVYVNLEQARQGCAAAGKRLCTAAEWRRACMGKTGLRFGYGRDYERGRCHTEDEPESGHSSMMDPQQMVAASGSFPRCVTPEGVYDLVGNAEEWVLDDWQGRAGMLEGGAWYTYEDYADCRGGYSRQADFRLDPAKEVFSAGFRCCLSDEALDADAIAADARARLATAFARASAAPYDTTAEVEARPGLWMDTYEFPNRPGEQPLAAVTWGEASTLCQAAGKRLCSTHEWEQVCQGEEGWAYPFGDRFRAGLCSVELQQPVPSGSSADCATPSGVHDLAGSLWEWTATKLDAPVLEGKSSDPLREIRGGSWEGDRMKARCRPEDGYPAAAPDARLPDVGFRCCHGALAAAPAAPTAPTGACPTGTTALDGFCIDTWEHPSQAGALPTGDLDAAGAHLACQQRGLRLCSRSEWQRACQGEEQRRWPYGQVYEPERCHDQAKGGEERAGQALPSGSAPGCQTPEGVFDLSGNLWEWVDDDGRPLLLGGGWSLSAGLNQCSAQAHAQPDYHTPQTGTRCCTEQTAAPPLPRPASTGSL